MNKRQSQIIEFWTQFNEMVAEKGRPFNIRKATTDHWYNIAIGISGAHVALDLVNKENCVVVELYISDDKELFDRLYENKEEIEGKMGLSLDWRRLNDRKASRILYKIDGLDFDDHSNYSELMNEMMDKGLLFVNVFKKYVKR